MARPVKPTALKVLKGTERPSRKNANEAFPGISVPSMPKHMSKEAGKEWRRITPLLLDLGLITEIDMAALTMYCVMWGNHVKAENMLRKHGLIITTPKGNDQVSPWVSISKHSMLAAHKFLVEFGLTPASRTKVSAAKKTKSKDKKERFFKNG